MVTTRSSRQEKAADRSSPASSQGTATTTGSKRKADTVPKGTRKKGKRADLKQTTIEDAMDVDPVKADSPEDDFSAKETKADAAKGDVDMSDSEETKASGALEDQEEAEESAVDEKIAETESAEKDPVRPTNGHRKDDETKDTEKDTTKTAEKGSGDDGTAKKDDQDTESKNAVQSSQSRAKSTPSAILEKGLIYFFFRGRVGIDDPSDVNEIARSYIILRPIPHDAKLVDGKIPDGGRNRILALPKKVLPASGRDKFLTFVEKTNASIEDIKKSVLSSDDYQTKTAGNRHSPAATPVGEGVYTISSTGRDSHLSYMLTIPSSISEVQKDVGIKEKASFSVSVKNPKYPSPPGASLPKSADYPQDVIDDFRSLRWAGLTPKHLEYENTQFLLIGHSSDNVEEIVDGEQQKDKKGGKREEDKPSEELEKLEQEDELRVEHLKGDDSVFVDLGLSHKEYSRVPTTW